MGAESGPPRPESNLSEPARNSVKLDTIGFLSLNATEHSFSGKFLLIQGGLFTTPLDISRSNWPIFKIKTAFDSTKCDLVSKTKTNKKKSMG